MNMMPPINEKILAVKIAFGDLHDECPFTKNIDDGLVECTHPAAEYIFPECLIEDCPFLNDTANALKLMEECPLA